MLRYVERVERRPYRARARAMVVGLVSVPEKRAAALWCCSLLGAASPTRPRAACATLGLLDGSSAGPSTDSLPRRDRVQRGHTKALFAFLTRVPFFFRPLPNLRRNSDASSRGTSPTGRSPSRRAGVILGASTEGRGGSSGASDLSQTLVTDPTRRPGTSSLTAS